MSLERSQIECPVDHLYPHVYQTSKFGEDRFGVFSDKINESKVTVKKGRREVNQ